MTLMTALRHLPADWQGWVHENVERGCRHDTMQPLLEQAGFSSHLAAAAINDALGLSSSDAGAAHRRPEPDLHANSQLCEGHEVRVALCLDRPRIVLFDGLLSAAECDALAALAEPRLAGATVVDKLDGVPRPHAHRRSAGAWFERGEGELISRIEARMAALLRWPVSHGEGLQVQRYEAGGEYRAHFDYFDPATPGSAPHLAQAGQRVGTLIVYLSDVAAGGGTRFPTLGLEVRPGKGWALYFADIDDQGEVDRTTLHAGLPVTTGVKLIATKWLRERVFGTPD